MRPLLDIINKSFQQFGIFQSKLAIDEMIVRYYGHNSLKQFIRGKPIRFGYKLWAICGSGGGHKFDLYCGKEERPELRDQPLGTRVVMDMLSVVSDPGGHEVFFLQPFHLQKPPCATERPRSPRDRYSEGK